MKAFATWTEDAILWLLIDDFHIADDIQTAKSSMVVLANYDVVDDSGSYGVHDIL